MADGVDAPQAYESVVRDLGERVKELTALHRCAQILLAADAANDDFLAEVAALLPPAFLHPEHATGCVRHGDRTYATAGHVPTPWTLAKQFTTRDGRGCELALTYHRALPDSGAGLGPFLAEEVRLLESLSEMVRGTLDRRGADQATRRARERLTVALTAAGMGAWEWDFGTDVMIWSDELARMVGRDGEMSGPSADFAALIHVDDHVHLVTRPAAGVDHLHLTEFRLRRADGGWRPVAATGRQVFDEDGAPRGLIGVVMDVTARRALEESLHQAQKLEALGQVAAGVAHDFNNILSVVISNCVLLKRAVGGGPVREMIDDVHDAASHGESLTRQLLTFSRNTTFRPDAVELDTVIFELQPLLRRMAGRAVEVKTVLAAGGARVWADASQLEQLAMNLVVNARDAMPQGGIVTIATRLDASADHVLIEVRDTGAGIPPEISAQMFDPFFSTKDPRKSTGLGLTVVRAVARRWYGDVTVDSAPGHGATFRIRLPRLRA